MKATRRRRTTSGSFGRRGPGELAPHEPLAGEGVVVEELEAEVSRLMDLLVERDVELGRSLDQLAATAPTGDDDIAYRCMLQRLRRLVYEQLPPGRRAVVVSSGDEGLLQYAVCRAEHMPQDRSGRYSDRVPDSDRSAIAQLEAARARGADVLIVPSSGEWWLNRFVAYARYLERRYTLVAAEDDTGAVWDLRSASPLRELDDLLAGLRVDAHEPAILDWQTGHDVAALFDECNVFAPEPVGPTLPYLDASVDVVAIGDPAPEMLGEAKRVASAAVVVFSRSRARPSIEIVWRSDSEKRRSTRVSVVVTSRDRAAPQPAFLRELAESLPRAFESEIVLPVAGAARASGVSEHVRTVRCRESDGAGRRLQRALEAATGDIAIVLGSELWPAGGWLPPLVHLLGRRPDAGAVTGLMVTPDGRVASRTAVRNGTGASASDDPDAVCHSYVRRLETAPSELVGAHRELLLQHSRRWVSRGDPLAAYCAAVVAHGLDVLYQPETLVVGPWFKEQAGPSTEGAHE